MRELTKRCCAYRRNGKAGWHGHCGPCLSVIAITHGQFSIPNTQFSLPLRLNYQQLQHEAEKLTAKLIIRCGREIHPSLPVCFRCRIERRNLDYGWRIVKVRARFGEQGLDVPQQHKASASKGDRPHLASESPARSGSREDQT